MDETGLVAGYVWGAAAQDISTLVLFLSRLASEGLDREDIEILAGFGNFFGFAF